MSLEAVKAWLAPFGLAEKVMEFAESSATVALAAEKVGTQPARIAKTLAFYDPSDDEAALLVVAAGDARLHSGSFKRLFGGKPRMVAPEHLEDLTGHPIGGVCPFANPAGTRVYLDVSLRRFATVFPAAGTAASAVEISLPVLEAASQAIGWVEATNGWQ